MHWPGLRGSSWQDGAYPAIMLNSVLRFVLALVDKRWCAIRIIPRYRLIISYDIIQESQEAYYRFVTTEFVPALRSMDVYIIDVHHVVWGDYPMRQTEFVAESLDIMRDALNSERFEELESTLRQYTSNYTRKVIPYREGFQL